MGVKSNSLTHSFPKTICWLTAREWIWHHYHYRKLGHLKTIWDIYLRTVHSICIEPYWSSNTCLIFTKVSPWLSIYDLWTHMLNQLIPYLIKKALFKSIYFWRFSIPTKAEKNFQFSNRGETSAGNCVICVWVPVPRDMHEPITVTSRGVVPLYISTGVIYIFYWSNQNHPLSIKELCKKGHTCSVFLIIKFCLFCHRGFIISSRKENIF